MATYSPFRQPKDRRRRKGGVRTSFIPHPDSIAGDHKAYNDINVDAYAIKLIVVLIKMYGSLFVVS